MGKITGFMDYKRKDCKREDSLSRLKHWNEFDTPLKEEERKEQAARCMDCGVPFCSSGIQLNGMYTGCPLHNLIPEWNHLIYLGRYELAAKRLLKTSNFPEFTSRVCPGLCEQGCTCGLNGRAVSVKANEKFIIEKAFAEGLIKANPPKIRTGKKVAVVGSGPAGLAAADILNKLGHNVVVYEREDKIGGLLRYGIPNMKLEKEIIDRRELLMIEEGITFETCCNIGKDMSFSTLEKSYDAVVVATGASKPRDTNAKGRNLKNIYYAVDFLKNNTKRIKGSKFNYEDISAKGKKVVVIGGGDTGTDCVATALRQGCKDVLQIEIMNKPPEKRADNNPWPEYAKVLKTDYGQEEYIAEFGHDPRIYCTTVKEFIGNEEGTVKSIVIVKVCWEKDEAGRVYPKEIQGSEEIIEADLVLLAMGFVGVEDYVAKDLAVDLDRRGNIKAEYEKFNTSREKVFVAGDARRGPSLVVWGRNEGRQAAFAVDDYLMNR